MISPEWLEQKSAGAICAADVVKVSLDDLDQASAGGMPHLIQRLAALQGNAAVVVDAEHQSQLAALAAAVLALKGERRFLFRSAASVVKALADPGPQPLDPNGLARLRRRGPNGEELPGLVMVGSHVPLADQQLMRLLADPAALALNCLCGALLGCWTVDRPTCCCRIWSGSGASNFKPCSSRAERRCCSPAAVRSDWRARRRGA